jgi:hypothetical protein
MICLGNVQIHVEINPTEGDETLRQVAVRVRRLPSPFYVAVGRNIPLK